MMYLKSGILGPHYVLQKFKATDALDTADLRMLKLSGVLRYKVRRMYREICLNLSTEKRSTSNS